MRIILRGEFFQGSSQDELIALETFLHAVGEEEALHALVTDPPYSPVDDTNPVSRWLQTLSGASRVHFSGILQRGLLRYSGTARAKRDIDPQHTPPRWRRASPLELSVERRAASDWSACRLTLQDAIDLLREPLRIYLENPRSDKAFLVLLAGPTDGPRLLQCIDRPGRVTVHGGGGGEIKALMNGLLAEPLSPSSWRRLLRTWVMFDVDAGEQDALRPSGAAERLMGACEDVAQTRHEFTWACLSRREIESYVPDDGLRAEALGGQQPAVDRVVAWRADPVLRTWAWAFDLKKGLHGDKRPNLTDAQREGLKDGTLPLDPAHLKSPFDLLTSAEVQLLQRGLGERLAEAMQRSPAPAWTAKVPDEYDRGPSSQAPRGALIQSLFDRM